MNLVTPEAAAKMKLLFNKLANDGALLLVEILVWYYLYEDSTLHINCTCLGSLDFKLIFIVNCQELRL